MELLVARPDYEVRGFHRIDRQRGCLRAMPAKRRNKAMRPNSTVGGTPEIFTPKIYYLNPLQSGARFSWSSHFHHCRDLGFDHVLIAPLFAPGAEGDIFLTANHDDLNPALNDKRSADELLAEIATSSHRHGLNLLVDVVVGRIAPDADLIKSNPGWFHLRRNAAERIDPRSAPNHTDAAFACFDGSVAAKELAAWWVARLMRLTRAGVNGFRCPLPHLVPPNVWRHIIGAVKQAAPDCRFLAWTPGLDWNAIARLRGLGFAAAFSSLPWWDGRASWFVEEHVLLRSIGSVIACPEAPFGPRLVKRSETSGNLSRVYRHHLRRAAAIGNGLLMPMGFEFASEVDMDSNAPSGNGTTILQDGNNLDLSAEVREANALCCQLASFAGELRMLNAPGQPVTALLRSETADARRARTAAVVMINPDLETAHEIPIALRPVPATAGASFSVINTIFTERDLPAPLDPGEVRILHAHRNEPIKHCRTDMRPPTLSVATRIIIDAVSPSVDAGRFAAKRIIGDPVTVEADVFIDGQDILVVECLWRPADMSEWRRVPMKSLGNDRWQGTILPECVGHYEFTVEAWVDRYGTLCRDLQIKRAAGSDISIECTEAMQLLMSTRERAEDDTSKVVISALEWLPDMSGAAAADLLLTPDLREVMREAEARDSRIRHEPTFPIEMERPQAAFGAWYELFPRSASNSANRHGTFADVVAKLPALKDMGFDVLYLPPIHPIGETNRKGRNNALRAQEGDPGSPYAVGDKNGGHDAIHPQLGSIEDFRRLRDAAAEYGLELALDFAIQCSPDHPWLEDHPEWFKWRADGSVRYAENPPKKYEDIVNVDFYAKEAIPDLWTALRDIVLFWINEGIRIFRVDNPHTKPLPFWEWLIAQVRGPHPDVIFLSEAFTRPKMMYRLAKAGFSQSYTYFTWRNSKQELVDYFKELTTSEVKEFFRPHLFVNTPDINPYFLQTSGRPGFLIRAALAATLSGLWGMYSGYELCEAAPLPGSEEYLNSEKYEIRVRSYDSPGNIVAEISKLNRIRKNNPSLHSHLGLRFYPAHSDKILLYGKQASSQMVLVAVSLDPFHVQDATIEVPLWEWHLPDTASVDVQDLMHETAYAWQGKLQRIRLDPNKLPFAIWRVTPRSEA